MWRSLISVLSPSGAGSAGSQPVDNNEFTTLMQPLLHGNAVSRIAIAVSGGPDSMALAWCVKYTSLFSNSTVMAFIVDHALRANSAEEAKVTKERLENIGIRTEVLRWEHKPITSKLHKSARDARYRLLTDACKRHGIADLLLAHQREDQAETILMRLAKGSGIDGLAGISSTSTKDGVRILRPFLNVSKERLVATCRANKISYVTDPSNTSDIFARGRLRRVLPLLAAEGITIDRLTDLGARAADAKAALDHATNLLLRVASTRDEAGAIRVDLEHLRSAPHAIALRALNVCLQNIHNEDYAAEHASLASVLNGLCSDDETPPRTLHGCLVSKSGSHTIIQREFSAITDVVEAKAGETVLWDGRWQVTNESNTTYTIHPLGSPPHETLDRLAPGLRHKIAQGRSRASLPSLWQGEALVLIPSLDKTNPHNAFHAHLTGVWPPFAPIRS